ncbi:hypothetical protein M438DRAFT_364503 [Aureobasidium pullulans EXF-150]|uniref:Uncharacterized protein n=1 Tax=Aureobasidium pullulans EXF-150 TaxID=1043002 RepID=A0A074XIQ9_AURPU|nr:uncharacterized protein M438DRAFT_364503 [Aureobasidium pullulans EXF-150]KEQ85410.1 hypothetical protein M438DRAFT_364503 [Aureobasidium pullulans EXF-150]
MGRRRGCSCQPRRLFRYDTSDRRLEVNLLSFSTLLRGPRSRPHHIRTWRTKVCQRSLETDLLRKRARRLLNLTIQKFARKERYRFDSLILRMDSYPRSSTRRRMIWTWIGDLNHLIICSELNRNNLNLSSTTSTTSTTPRTSTMPRHYSSGTTLQVSISCTAEVLTLPLQ